MFRSRLAPAAAVIGILLLAGCAPTPEPSSTPSAAASENDGASAEPTVSTESAIANVPTDCAAVGTAESRADTVDQLTLQGDGVGFERPVPEGATLLLGCDWFAGDTTGLLLLISEVDPAAAEAYVATLPDQGYTCVTGDAGNPVCQMVTPSSEYPVDTVETITSREDIWIYSSSTNLDADMLLSDLNQQIWAN